MVTFESPHKSWPGSFSLPDYADFTGRMFNEYRDGMNARKEDKSAYTHDMRRKAAFVGVEWVKKYGSWDVKEVKDEKVVSIAIETFMAWENEPDNERPRLVAWVGQSIAEYYQAAIDPNG